MRIDYFLLDSLQLFSIWFDSVVFFFFFFKILFIHDSHRERERVRDTGRGRSRLHAPGARCGIRSRVSRIAPWAKGRRQTAAPPRDPQIRLFSIRFHLIIFISIRCDSILLFSIRFVSYPFELFWFLSVFDLNRFFSFRFDCFLFGLIFLIWIDSILFDSSI